MTSVRPISLCYPCFHRNKSKSTYLTNLYLVFLQLHTSLHSHWTAPSSFSQLLSLLPPNHPPRNPQAPLPPTPKPQWPPEAPPSTTTVLPATVARACQATPITPPPPPQALRAAASSLPSPARSLPLEAWESKVTAPSLGLWASRLSPRTQASLETIQPSTARLRGHLNHQRGTQCIHCLFLS